MSLVKRGRVWHYDFRLRGRRYKGTTHQTSKMLARRFEDDKQKEIREGREIQDITFEDFVKEYRRLHVLGKKSCTFYLNHLKILGAHFGKTFLADIRVKEVEEFAAIRRAKVRPSTANRSLAVLKSMFSKAMDWGYARENPVRRVKLQKENNKREFFLTEAQAEDLLKAASEKVRPVILAALHTGARRGELLKLDWEDTDLRTCTLHFRDTKNGADRAVPVDGALEALLRSLESRLMGGPVFVGDTGRLTVDELRNGFEKAVRKAGLTGLRFHDLRHSYASFLARAGVPLNTIRELLGHRSLEMTLRYSHLSPDYKREAVTVLDGLFSGVSPQKSPQSAASEDLRR